MGREEVKRRRRQWLWLWLQIAGNYSGLIDFPNLVFTITVIQQSSQVRPSARPPYNNNLIRCVPGARNDRPNGWRGKEPMTTTTRDMQAACVLLLGAEPMRSTSLDKTTAAAAFTTSAPYWTEQLDRWMDGWRRKLMIDQLKCSSRDRLSFTAAVSFGIQTITLESPFHLCRRRRM